MTRFSSSMIGSSERNTLALHKFWQRHITMPKQQYTARWPKPSAEIASSMTTIITLYTLGLAGVIGCFCGATHHAMTAAVCIILATRLLQERIEERRAKN